MATPEIKRENPKPYLSLETSVKSRLHLSQAELSRRALEVRIKAQRGQEAADRAYERRIGHRSPSKS